MAVGGLVAAIALVVGLVASSDDGPRADTPTPTSVPAPTTASTTTGSTSTSTTSTPLPHGVTPLDTTAVVWPTAASGTRFADPATAAASFATTYLGFTNPVVGPFQAGADGSGTVVVRAKPASTSATTIQLRRLEPDRDWWVVGATNPDIELDRPMPLDATSSPVTLTGRSSAFEGNVGVTIRADDRADPLASSFVTGGSTAELGPFNGQVPFAPPGASANGAVVLQTRAAEDGSVIGATVVRVRFGQPGVDGQPASTCTTPPTRLPLAAGQAEVRTFFTCGPPTSGLLPVFRVVPDSSAVLRASLEQLVAGPTTGERAGGLGSPFSPDTLGMVTAVDLGPDGSARVDLADFRQAIPAADTAAGATTLLAQLDATVFQFPSVRSVVYRIAGDCEQFGRWLGIDGCQPRVRPTS